MLLLLLLMTQSALAFFMEGFLNPQVWQKDERLPTEIYPSDYALLVVPNIRAGNFSGIVKINVTCRQPTTDIVLHAHEDLHIDIGRIILTSRWNSRKVHVKQVIRNATTDQLKIILKKKMRIGHSYQLQIEFDAKMKKGLPYYQEPNNSYCGFFKGNFTDMGNVSLYAGTHMGMKCGRRIFPCFDEPGFKATFRISVACPQNMTVHSVMPVEFSEKADEENWTWVHFAPTPPISTLSVNIFVSSLIGSEPVNVTTKYGKYKFQFHHRPNSRNQSSMTEHLEHISQMVVFLEDFLGVPFPVPKMDFLFLPQFMSEQTYFGTAMHSDDLIELGYFILIPDLVDQWFVHAVTPEWWDGFNMTNILGLYVVKAGLVNVTNKDTWKAYGTHEFYNLLSDPSFLRYSEEFGSMFDMIKGDWFLQMLTSTISENTVKKSLKTFLNENLFDTYYEAVFWDALTDEARNDETLAEDVSLETLVNSWLHKHLFPVLTVNRNYEENSAVLEQHTFVPGTQHFHKKGRLEMPPDNFTQIAKEWLWWVPFSYIIPCNMKSHSIHPSAWMKEERQINVSNLPDASSYVIANPTDSGMFLVNYDQKNWNLIMQSLLSSENKLPTLTRKKIIQDATILAVNDQLPLPTFLNMTVFLINETETSVWLSFVTTLSKDMEGIFWWTPVEDKFNFYVRRLLTPLYKSIERPENPSDDFFDGFDLDAELLRYDVKRVLEKVGYQPFINKNHNKSLNGFSTYPVRDDEIQLIIFCPEFLKNISSNSDWLDHVLQLDKYTQGLSYNYVHFWRQKLARCPYYEDFIDIILNATLNDNTAELASNNWDLIVKALITNPTAHNITFNFLLDNFEALKTRFLPAHDLWRQFVTAVTGKVTSEEQLEMLVDFYRHHKSDLGYVRHYISSAIKQANATVEWNKQTLPGVIDWFNHVLPTLSGTV